MSFSTQCQQASRDLRRMPADLRRALASEVKDEVAVPLASKIGQAATGPWGPALAASTKARALADPTIVIGGSKRVVSGGANARQLVYGTEFGGGKRITRVPGNAKHRGYRRWSTRQFARHHKPFVFPTLGKSGEWVLEKFAEIVGRVIGDG